jgi:N-formylmaleamate deformylase
MKRLALAFLVACSSGHTPPPAAPSPAAPTAAAPAATASAAFGVHVTGTGRPVIFIPGLGCGGDVWDGTVAHLGGKVEAHVLTLAGFGGQPAIAAPLLQTVHDQLVAYIREQHLDHPVIVGHSLGGVMSLWLAETDPELGGVIDVDGLPFLPAVDDPSMTVDKVTPMAKQMHDQLVGMPAAKVAELMRDSMKDMVTKPADLDRVMVAVAKSDPSTVATAFEELFTTDLRPKASAISVPVLIVAAGDNRGATRAQVEDTWHKQIDAIPHHQLEVVDGAKHFVMLDQPDAFYKLLDGFLAAHAR